MSGAPDPDPSKTAGAPGPLAGVVVVDLSRIFAGPFATQILGDLGADIIKVERVDGGDEARDYGVADPSRTPGAPFLAMNRNKRSIALDLKSEDGREVAQRLVDRADVVIHNYRPGVMDRLGLGYETLSKRNPRIVYCSISGFGSVGRLRNKAANDLTIQAYSGLLSITGEPDGPPVRTPASISDLTAGLYAVTGILSALLHRSSTGKGQQVETSLLESLVNILNHYFVDYWLNGTVPQRMGTANRLGIPNQAFPTADGWVCITTPNEASWLRCCRALDVEPLASDDRFATHAARYAHRPELVEALSRATKRFTTAECVGRLEDVGVPSAPVNTIPNVAADPQLEILGGIVSMHVARFGQVKLVASPLHLSVTPTSARLPPPQLGEHTDEILERAGYTREMIDHLRRDRAVQ